MTRHHEADDVRWLTLAHAAYALDLSADALRRTLDRHSVRTPDGGIEAHIDGVIGRKFGRLWRVMLGERWIGADRSGTRRRS